MKTAPTGWKVIEGGKKDVPINRTQHDVMWDILSSFHAWSKQSEESPAEIKQKQQLAERRNNRLEHLRILLGIVEWRYLLLPLAVRSGNHGIYHNNNFVVITTKQLYVFGIRVARWFVSQQSHRLSMPKRPSRLKLHHWKRRTRVRGL